jgi:hypothetical protein
MTSKRSSNTATIAGSRTDQPHCSGTDSLAVPPSRISSVGPIRLVQTRDAIATSIATVPESTRNPMYFAADARFSVKLLGSPSPDLQRDGREQDLVSGLLELLGRELGSEIRVALEEANVLSNP